VNPLPPKKRSVWPLHWGGWLGLGLGLLATGAMAVAQSGAPGPLPSVPPSPVPSAPQPTPPQPTPPQPTPPAVPALVPAPRALLGPDEQLFSRDRPALLTAIDHSRRYLRSDRAVADYRRLARRVPALSHACMVRSVDRFRQLVATSSSSAALTAAVNREFVLYQATGKDGQGGVAFTGYFEPVHQASRVPTAEFRYPLFRTPPDLTRWPQPHPTRADLEGADGLQFAQGPLRGLELVWLRDRLEAFLVQVQGSARLQLTDGSTMTIGYGGSTNYPYTGVGRELVKAGKFTLEELTLERLTQYFQANPAELDLYLPRNQRFIFFQNTRGAAAMGSIGVPVTAERSIATDKTLFPPGAIAQITTDIPFATSNGALQLRRVSRFVLDQDTGSAIRGPGRVDVFMGTGVKAGQRAGLINATGRLYYFVLRCSA
jgi:membrane-bound lytic murein transglycosylase A